MDSEFGHGFSCQRSEKIYDFFYCKIFQSNDYDFSCQRSINDIFFSGKFYNYLKNLHLLFHITRSKNYSNIVTSFYQFKNPNISIKSFVSESLKLIIHTRIFPIQNDNLRTCNSKSIQFLLINSFLSNNYSNDYSTSYTPSSQFKLIIFKSETTRVGDISNKRSQFANKIKCSSIAPTCKLGIISNSIAENSKVMSPASLRTKPGEREFPSKLNTLKEISNDLSNLTTLPDETLYSQRFRELLPSPSFQQFPLFFRLPTFSTVLSLIFVPRDSFLPLFSLSLFLYNPSPRSTMVI